uniref:DNA-directed RNA polymerase n=1 Tax=viral metagenome TaxID=1070528 RepID=A0A6C0DRY7_9ZZZZ
MSYESVSDLPLRILNAYYEQTPLFLTRHHIDSYEHFVFNEMSRLIHSMNPILILKEPLAPDQGLYKYKTEIYIGGKVAEPKDLRINVGAPIITLDGGKTVRRMFPNEARLRGLTYAALIRADIDIVVTRTVKQGEEFVSSERTIPFTNFPLFRLPVLLRSKLCVLGESLSDDAAIQMGESPLEHGGYFIIDGAEKLLITRQEQAFNSLYVARKAPTDLETSVYVSVVSQNPETKTNRRCSIYLDRESSVMRVSVPSVRGNIPLFVLFRALGIESDREIIRMIFPDETSAFTRLYEDLLIPSIEDAWPITTQAMAIHFIASLTHQGSVASVLDILRNSLFSHVPNRPMARAYFLAEMVQKAVKSNARILANTDRDDIRNQRLLTTGTLLRDLFAAVWKDWQKAVRLAIDTQYNYNKTLYEGDRFIDLFSAGNANAVFQIDALQKAIMRGFRGRWGTNPKNEKAGVLQPVARISFYDAMSHSRRILLDFDTSLKQKGPRQLHPSQIGYFCTNETPTGAHIGVTKNYTMLTYVSLAGPVAPVLDWLERRGGMTSIFSADRALRASGTLVKINGGTVGFVKEPIKLLTVLKLLKWTACLAPTASVSFNTFDREIRVYLDEGRPLRPLWHLAEGGQWPTVAKELMAAPDAIPVWRNLLIGTLPLTKERTVADVDFIDPLYDTPAATLDDYIKVLKPHAGVIEYVDPYESNEAFISWWGSTDLGAQHTHVEIHPSTMMGLMVNMIPFANHNQSPRNQLSCSQSKQGIGYYATNYLQRYDTYASQLCYGEAPLVRTLAFDHAGRGQAAYGFNCIVAMASTDGYNQDDGILFNRSAIERGMFRSLSFRSYDALEEIDQLSKVEYKIANPKLIPAWTDIRPGYDYSKLDEQGIIREGEVVEDHTILVGRYLEDPETHQIKDSSVMPSVFTRGRVDSVVVLHQANGMRLVRIRILEERIPELGDKFGSRHGQKGTMGMLIAAENMPHTASGIIPDVIVNPHGLTSRMTVAQLLEVLFGRFGAETGAKCNATSFFNREDIVKTIGDSLEAIGLNPYTENLMYCGTTGKQLACSIFMGPLYFMRMRHLTQDKLNSRGAGRREVRTHQPTGGRGNEGGMRIGEMERDAVLAHGVSLFLQESMMKRADATDFWICNGCGTIPIYNEREGLFVCPMCDGPVEFSGTTEENITLIKPLKRSRVTFSKIAMPFALKLLDQEITAFTGTGFRYVTERSVGRLKDNMLKWSSIDSSNESNHSGGGPPQDPLFVKAATAGLELQKTASPSDGLPGPPNEIIYEEATANQHGGAALEGAPVNAIDPVPTEHKMEGGANAFEPPTASEQASLDTALKGTDLGGTIKYSVEGPCLQSGGAGAPLNEIGTDINTSALYEPARGEPTFTIPNPLTSPPIQKGGASVEPTPAVTVGTEINSATFNEPARGEPTFTVANPYTAPPLPTGTTVLPGPQSAAAEAISTFEVPKALQAEVAPVVQQGGGDRKIVFDDAEVKVVRIE